MNRRVIGSVVGVRRLGLSLLLAIAAACSQDGPPTHPTAAGTSPPAQAASDTAPRQAPQVEELSEPVLVWAEAEPETGPAPLSVRLTAEIEGGTPPFTITWRFGDGSPNASERHPVHTYEVAGTYRAELEVADSAGDADSDWVEITADTVPPPVTPVTPAEPPPAR